MTTANELDVISKVRGEVYGNIEATGENLFLAWGYPTAFFLFVEFLALILWNEFWCFWIWLGIPLVGTPLMVYFLNEDYERTHRRTIDQNVILQMWIFVGFLSCLGGVTMGFAGVFDMLYCTFQGLLIGFGCLMTGLILHFRPKTVCGIIGCVISFVCLFFQGDFWSWQLLIAVFVTILTLIIPGHLFRHYVKKQRL
jgi:hypothetical protein